MTPEDILSHRPNVLTPGQREAYFASGFVAAEGLIGKDWLDRLNAASDELIEASRTATKSGGAYDLAPDHSAERPHVRRIKSPVDHHPTFRELATKSPFVEIAADLVGPDVKFHSCKINYKHPGAAEIVKWHQDICFWPHTNYSPVTLGLYLDGCDAAMGPLACLPESHKGELFPHRDAAGEWTGTVPKSALDTLPLDRVEAPEGPPGTFLALNCRTVHGSQANRSDRVRPMLLYVYCSADAFAFTRAPTGNSLTGEIVRGHPARTVHMDPRPCPVPPDWSKTGYGSIFTSQEKGDAAGMM